MTKVHNILYKAWRKGIKTEAIKENLHLEGIILSDGDVCKEFKEMIHTALGIGH